MGKKTILLLIVFLFFSILNGCSQSSVKQDLTLEEGYVIITDYLGNQVKVKQDPEYIGSLFAVSSHIIAMYGDAEKIVTIAEGNTRDFLFCEIYPQILNARIVKGSNVINIEEVAKQPRPEVLIADPGVTLDEVTAKKLAKLGIPIVTISYDGVEQQQQIMEMLGVITGSEEEAAAYNEYYQSVIDLVTSRTASIPDEERKTVYHAINELLRTSKAHSLSAELLDLVGVKNVGLLGEQEENPGIDKNYIALEELFKQNPDYIIINGADVLDYINASPQLHNLKAYREGHVYLLPLGVTRWGHPNSIESPLAILWLAKTVYPQLFSDVDMEKETREFYRNFFDYELSDSQLDKIMSGRVYKDIKGSSSLSGG